MKRSAPNGLCSQTVTGNLFVLLSINENRWPLVRHFVASIISTNCTSPVGPSPSLNMNDHIRHLLALSLLSGSLLACNSEGAPSTGERQLDSPLSHTEETRQADEVVVNVQDEGDCESYLKGRSFTGGNARIDFGIDGSVGAYSVETGELVFGGTLSMGPTYGQASRSMSVVSMTGGERLEMMLSSDGKIMDKSSLVIYRPE